MQTSRILVDILVILVLLISITAANNGKTTILVSFDGFRWDYISKTNTPNMDFIVTTGVKAPYINPVFPTETVPNHYSMTTGLYPESHGILSGYYTYDPVWNSSFSMNNTDSRWWDGGEPVWVTNQRHGHRSGVCYFPGYDVKIRGHFPSFSSKDFDYGKPFIHANKSFMPFHQQVDTIIKWMKDKNPPSFIAVYFRQPDEASHAYGPGSPELIQQVQRCDNITGYLLKRLKEDQFLESTNLIITGDHGHASYNTSTFLNFDDYISQDKYHRFGLTTIQIFPEQDHFSDVYKSFKNMENETHLISVYKIKDLPEKYHFKNNRRVPPLIAIMKEHWIGNNTGFWKIWRAEKKDERTDRMRGDHVYRPELMSMKPFFIAKGPSFKQGYVCKPFDIIDIYPMICHLLGIPPAPNNGSLDSVKDVFEEQLASPSTWSQRMANVLDDAWKGVSNTLH